MTKPRRSLRSTFALHCAIVLCAVPAALACNDSVSPSKGTLTGTLVLQDSWGNRLDDFSNASISVDGVSATATTDAAGSWHIDGVPDGTRTITFKKAAFGTVQLTGQVISSPSTTAPSVTMALTPWQQAVIDSIHLVTHAGKDYYIVDGHLSAPPPANARYVSTVVYMGKTSSVSPDPASFGQYGTFGDATGKLSTFSAPFSVDAAQSAFGSGTQVYIAAFLSATACTCYPENPSDKPFYTNTGPRANVVPLTLR